MRRICERRNVVRIMDLTESWFGTYNPENKEGSITLSTWVDSSYPCFYAYLNWSRNFGNFQVITFMGKTFLKTYCRYYKPVIHRCIE